MSAASKIPPLRFKGFEGAWEEKRLSVYLKVSGEQNEDNRFGVNDVLSVSGEAGVVNQIEFQGRSFAGASVSGYHVLHKGQLTYTKSPLKANPYGIIKANKGKDGIVSALYGVYDCVEGTCADFVQCYFDKGSRLNNYLRPLVCKGAKNTLLISDEEALQGGVVFPANTEQEQIAQCCRSLDALITGRESAVEKLRTLKKAMLEKMFPRAGAKVPEVRFKGFDREWESVSIDDAAEVNPSSVLPDAFEYVDLESVTGTEMIAHRTESKISAPSRAQRLAKRGDVFYQTVRPYQKNNFLFDVDVNRAYVFSTGYAQLRPRCDGYYLLSYLQTDEFVNKVLMECTGTSYPAISDTNLAKLKIFLPGDVEQRKIGAYFRSLDALISARQEEVGKLKDLKKALLDRMFV